MSQRPLQFPFRPLHPHSRCQCCCWIMDAGREGESQRHQDGHSSAVLGETLPQQGGSLPCVVQCSPPGSFTPHCEVLCGRKSNELIVGRSVCFLWWINGDRMSRAQSVCAFGAHSQQVQVVCLCVVGPAGANMALHGRLPTNGGTSNYFVYVSTDTFISFSKDSSAVR